MFAERTDPLRRRRDELDFPKELSPDTMIEKARELGFPILVKNGYNGKWYLKGKGRTRQVLIDAIDKARGQSREGVYSILLD